MVAFVGGADETDDGDGIAVISSEWTTDSHRRWMGLINGKNRGKPAQRQTQTDDNQNNNNNEKNMKQMDKNDVCFEDR